MIKRKYWVLVIVIVALACLLILRTGNSAYLEIDENEFYPVTKVLDGDTFNVSIDKREITVRLLGINTPETVDPRRPPECYGVEASNETKRLLTGNSVKLELNPKREVRDKYGRYLVYAYLRNDELLNEYLIEKGFAREYTFGKPYSLQKDFRNAEKFARNANAGLWSACEGLFGVDE
jgi:micrococcal nuclease